MFVRDKMLLRGSKICTNKVMRTHLLKLRGKLIGLDRVSRINLRKFRKNTQCMKRKRKAIRMMSLMTSLKKTMKRSLKILMVSQYKVKVIGEGRSEKMRMLMRLLKNAMQG
jgi:hypothetical protein